MSQQNKIRVSIGDSIKQSTITNEVLTLGLFLVIFTNFILAILLVTPLLGYKIPNDISNTLIIIFAFIYYILFLFGLTHYQKKFHGLFKKNETKYLSILLVVGVFIAGIISYKLTGLSDTMQWFVPTLVTLVLAYIFYKLKFESAHP